MLRAGGGSLRGCPGSRDPEDAGGEAGGALPPLPRGLGEDRRACRGDGLRKLCCDRGEACGPAAGDAQGRGELLSWQARRRARTRRSEEHTSELQSRQYLVCRLLLEKKKND